MTVTLSWGTILTGSALLVAVTSIITYFAKAVRWMDRQKKQDEELAAIKAE